MRCTLIALGLLALAPIAHADDTALTPPELMTKIATLIEDQFVDEDIAHASAPKVRALAGSYDDHGSPEALADAITRDLRAVTGDSHIGVTYDPAAVSRFRAREAATHDDAARERDTANKARKAAEAAADNFGIRAVSLMPGGVGYLRLDEFYGQVTESEDMFAHVMTLLGPAKAIILDLRHNGGGNSRLLPLFLGYFLGPDAVTFATRHERWKGDAAPLVTRTDMAGARHHGKPLYILTSGLTYSLAEHVTYHLRALAGATVVGERTFGGGNGWDPVVLDDRFYLRLPRLAFTNAKTGTLYTEHVGISPDVAATAAAAQDTAYRAALTRLAASPDVETEACDAAEWALAALPPAAGEATTPGDDAVDFGRFGDFALQGTKDSLWLSFRGAPYVRLSRAADGAWLDDRSIPRLISLEGRAPHAAITVRPYDGEAVRIPLSGSNER
ncbi:S41 family peptidase [Kordiimonas gwangyangensis]|uniref:S41 family peptidase n=1 Tax=Kordiimonas gwangyangensis TaxID=288022 RepID=UPI00036E2684|nr:S41 family peptidase [Kordiimonas gwangyangensis]